MEVNDTFEQFSFPYLAMNGLTRLKTGRTKIAQAAQEPSKNEA